MASRGITTVPVFYVSEEGVIYSIQESDYAPDKSRDVEESRIRLANVLRQRKQQQKENSSAVPEVLNTTNTVERTNVVPISSSMERLEIDSDDNNNVTPPPSNQVNNIEDDWCSSDEDDDDDESDCSSDDDFETEEEISSSLRVHPSSSSGDPSNGGSVLGYPNDIDRRLIRHGVSQQRLATSLLQRDEQLRRNQMLARSAARTMRTAGNSSKALPSQFVHQPSPADNAAARAIVHHTGSHYHMAGGVQFQRGVRVKGVVSRHSKQGAKLQAARMAQRNMYEAREDARGERTEGAGRSKMKQKKKKTKKEAGAKDA